MSSEPSFEPHVVSRRLRDGTTSDVYLARHEALGRDVWIKALRARVPISSPFASALEREATMLARVSDDNVQAVYELVRRPDALWVVLEAIDGFSLREILEAAQRAGTTLEVRAAAGVVLQVARGLASVHAQGLVHAAVQPRNIFVAQSGVCKLAGFSSAFERGEPPPASELSDSTERLEAPYSSPEHVLGEDPTPASDVFSLGVVAYELLGGRLPWEAEGEVETPRDIRHSTPPPLGRSRHGVPPALERLVGRCLEKRRDQRFADGAELVEALEEFLGREGLGSTAGGIARGLETLGFEVPRAPAGRLEAQREARRRQATRGLRHSLAALVVVSMAMAMGGGAMAIWMDGRKPPRLSTESLDASSAGLRVVADPWAHVFVDGRHRETTPFATPLWLSPGVHHLRFEHPDAPTERRRVVLVAGETLWVDVPMQLSGSSVDAGWPSPTLASERDAGPASP